MICSSIGGCLLIKWNSPLCVAKVILLLAISLSTVCPRAGSAAGRGVAQVALQLLR